MKIRKFNGAIQLEQGDSTKIWNNTLKKYIVISNDYADNIFIEEKNN